MCIWQRFGQVEIEYDGRGFTGWCRRIDGQQADGHWPQWNNKTGATR